MKDKLLMNIVYTMISLGFPILLVKISVINKHLYSKLLPGFIHINEK